MARGKRCPFGDAAGCFTTGLLGPLRHLELSSGLRRIDGMGGTVLGRALRPEHVQEAGEAGGDAEADYGEANEEGRGDAGRGPG